MSKRDNVRDANRIFKMSMDLRAFAMNLGAEKIPEAKERALSLADQLENYSIYLAEGDYDAANTNFKHRRRG